MSNQCDICQTAIAEPFEPTKPNLCADCNYKIAEQEREDAFRFWVAELDELWMADCGATFTSLIHSAELAVTRNWMFGQLHSYWASNWTPAKAFAELKVMAVDM